MMIYLVILFGILQKVSARSLGYNDESLYDCDQNQNYTEQDRRDILKLYPIDAFLFIIIGPIAFLICLALISIFLRYPQIRKSPGDLLLGLCICDLFQSLHYIMSGSFYFMFHESPINTSVFCSANGTISVLVFVGNVLYNIAFVCSPLVLVSNTLQGTSFFQKKIHVVIFMCSISVTSFSIASGTFQLNLSGLCTISPNNKSKNILQTIFLFLFLLIYVITAVIVLRAFSKKTQLNNEKHADMRKKYLFIYKRFVIATLIIWTVQLILETLINLNCYVLQEPKLNIALTMSNFVSVMIPIIQCYIRAQDPVLISKIKKLWGQTSLIPRQKTQAFELTVAESRTDVRTESQPDILHVIQKSIRKTQVYSIIAGVLMMNREFVRSKTVKLDLDLSDNQGDDRKKSNIQYKFDWKQSDQCDEMIIDEKSVQDAFPGKHEFNVFQSKVTAYCPEIFKYLLVKDSKMVNLDESLDLFKNKENLTNFGGPDGGKSGEFFFFSWDKKIIIKTMKWSEVMALKERIQVYGNYLYNHSDSLISKIYGCYTFRRLNDDDSDSSVHVLIMRNISQGYKNIIIIEYHLNIFYVLLT